MSSSIGHAPSRTRRLVTKGKRVIVTDLDNDALVELWRGRYDRIFANEVKERRRWGFKRKPEELEVEIAARQAEWDRYVAKKLADLATAKEA